jgi:polygalacturonase
VLRRRDRSRVSEALADDATRFVQRAIDGGGHVRLDPGTYVVRTLQLRSNLTLEVPPATTLRAHPENNAFDLQEKLPYNPHADMETSDFAHGMLVGRHLDGVSIVGGGTIDLARTMRWGPKPIALKQCRDVRIEGITIRRAPNYAVSLGACDGVVIAGVTIRESLSDGIDPDSCRRVRIAHCDIESDDDAICIKASLFLGAARASEDIEVMHCRTRSGTNGFKIGTETSGSVRRVRVEDCDFDARPRAGRDPAAAEMHDLHEAGGVSIQTVDGGDVEEVTIEGVRIAYSRGAISLRRGARGRGQEDPTPGVLRDVAMRDIDITAAREPSSMSGLPGYPVERVTFERMRAQMCGGVNEYAKDVPEFADAYPKNTMFGVLPAWGLYARHVDGLELRDVAMHVLAPDAREMFVLDDVRALTQ